MLSAIAISTTEYIKIYSKLDRKEKGQFFTCASTAKFMADMISIEKREISILDPGAGTGILSVAAIEKLISSESIKHIKLDLFENDLKILPTLKSNLELLKQTCYTSNKMLEYTIYSENFILHFADFWDEKQSANLYDVIISNPPYTKIGKNASEAKAMMSIVYGQPNLYFLFMALSCKLLDQDGEMIFIVPRSWVSGLYFTKFREFFLNRVKISNLHLFISRDKVFKTEDVLQETVIVKATKIAAKINSINISISNTSDEFSDLSKFEAPLSSCISSNGFVFLPTSKDEVEILERLNHLPQTLVSLGYKAKTGLVVDFRSQDYLKQSAEKDAIPLLWAQNFDNGLIRYPNIKIESQYISISKKSLLMRNGNYLFIKRFSAKEEKRRLQAAIYLSDSHGYISSENHLNFICKASGALSKEETWGLYTIFNSSLWDNYLRIMNGSTQVNSNELNAMPLPDKETIMKIGKAALVRNALSTNESDRLIEEYIKWEN